MTSRPALRDHVATMIMDRAATVLAERGDALSMTEIARAAGVGRATLYRYFPNRDALLSAMADAALDDLAARIDDARLDTVPVGEAIARITRAFIGSGKYAILARDEHGACERSSELDRRLTTPLRQLFQKGIDTGVLRADLSADLMLMVSGALLQTGIEMAAIVGGEQASATITSLFLDGVRAPTQDA
ncbi:TetR/AcrR family transcriptional regulator [Antrihabitans sp. NCIMB 15449]|uniref:TetR/AcrR family transcriptional regulator n=1 Tax=Antrihabitans spumae TaxID=3373370 RepID=A0ABW7JH72_9NOCA